MFLITKETANDKESSTSSEQSKYQDFYTEPVDYDLPEALYDCVAVVNHYGSYGGGHYVACAKNASDKKWRMFDDSHVKVIDNSSVITENAYILFYIRRDISNVSVENLFECFKSTTEHQEEYQKCMTELRGSLEESQGKCIVS